MIKDLFKTTGDLSGGQYNFLKVMSRLPEIKSSMGDNVTNEDSAIANEADSILNTKSD